MLSLCLLITSCSGGQPNISVQSLTVFCVLATWLVVCVADCSNHVRRVLLAGTTRRVVRQTAANHLLQEVGKHSHSGSEWRNDAVSQSLRLPNPCNVTGCSQHGLRRKILKLVCRSELTVTWKVYLHCAVYTMPVLMCCILVLGAVWAKTVIHRRL